MNQNTAAAIVGALNSVTEALTTVAALSLQQPEAAVIGEARTTKGNDSQASSPRFIDQGDGTVIDTAHHLQWSKATLTPKCISQHAALKLCEGLTLGGHSDWRLPTRAELLTLVDDTRHAQAIDTEFFPDTKNDWYWTSTVCAWSSVRAWYVYFDSGYCGDDSRGDGYGLVRAVRALTQAPPAAVLADGDLEIRNPYRPSESWHVKPANGESKGRYSVGMVEDGTGHCILFDGMECGGQWSGNDAETMVRALNAKAVDGMAEITQAWNAGYKAGVEWAAHQVPVPGSEPKAPPAAAPSLPAPLPPAPDTMGLTDAQREVEDAFRRGWNSCRATVMQSPPAAVPAGYALVPVEPTEAMRAVFRAERGSATEFTHTVLQCADFDSRYRAMLAAAKGEK